MDTIIDRKFMISAINPCNGNEYTHENALLLCAKDRAVPAALKAYYFECEKIGCNHEHLQSIKLLIERVEEYQQKVESRVPDTIGKCEVDRCLHGKGMK